jgi:hypothetical protein
MRGAVSTWTTNRSKLAVTVILTASLTFYFTAPVVFWFNFYRSTPPTHNEKVFGVYRTISCEAPGLGLTYTTYGHVYFSCSPAISTGAPAERVTIP